MRKCHFDLTQFCFWPSGFGLALFVVEFEGIFVDGVKGVFSLRGMGQLLLIRGIVPGCRFSIDI